MNLESQQKAAREALLAHPAIKAADDAIVLQALRTSTKGYEGPNLADFMDEQIAQTYHAGAEAGYDAAIDDVEQAMKAAVVNEIQPTFGGGTVINSYNDPAKFIEELKKLRTARGEKDNPHTTV